MILDPFPDLDLVRPVALDVKKEFLRFHGWFVCLFSDISMNCGGYYMLRCASFLTVSRSSQQWVLFVPFLFNNYKKLKNKQKHP